MQTDPVDVLIIGAGASGAAIAWSLLETRMRILCLEQGPNLMHNDFPSLTGHIFRAKLQDIKFPTEFEKLDVLKMSGFDHVLELVPTLEEALQKF